jgi:hypothetical protein
MNEQGTPDNKLKLVYPSSNDGPDGNIALTSSSQLPPKSLITMGEVAHFTVGDNETSRDLAKTLAKDTANALNIPESRTFGFARDGSVADLGENFEKDFLLPRLSTAGEGGKLMALDMEEALNNARINIVTHSFGQRIANGMGKQLVEDLQNPDIFEKPYTAEQANAIAKQILVVGLGAALDYDHVKMAESGEISYASPDTPLNNIGLYANREESVRSVAAAYPEAFVINGKGHDQDRYLEAIRDNPELSGALNQLINADRLPDNASLALDGIAQRASILNDNPELNPKEMFSATPAATPVNPAINPLLQGLAAIEGVTVDTQNNKVLFKRGGGVPNEILTIRNTEDGIQLDPDRNQRANLGKAMDGSAALQDYVLNNENGVFSDRANIMARHQLEAKLKKGELDKIPANERKAYDFEDRIRKDMSEKEERKATMKPASKFEVPDGVVFGFPGEAPDGKPAAQQPVDPLDPREEIVEENRNAANRKAKEEKRLLDSAIPMDIKPGDTITIGGLDHFQGSDQDVRLRNTMKFPAELADALGQPAGKFKAIMITAGAKEKIPNYDDEGLGEYLARNVLLKRVTKPEGESLVPLAVDEAKANMRINFVTHSFGGKLVSRTIESLEKMMIDPSVVQPPYSQDDAKKIAGQALQFDLGPAMGYNWQAPDDDMHIAFNPASTRAQAFLPKDPDLESVRVKINIGAEDIQNSNVYVLEAPEPPHQFQSWGTDYNFNGGEQHTRALYIESMRNNPQLLATLRDVITSPEIDREAVLQDFAKSMTRIDVTRSSELPPLEETAGTEINAPAKQQARGT